MRITCEAERGTLPATIRLGTETSIPPPLAPLILKLNILASIMKQENPFDRQMLQHIVKHCMLYNAEIKQWKLKFAGK